MQSIKFLTEHLLHALPGHVRFVYRAFDGSRYSDLQLVILDVLPARPFGAMIV